MPIAIARIKSNLDQLYCPFTGEPVHGEDGENALSSLLFSYYGDAGEYGYVSDRFAKILAAANIECDDDTVTLSPEDIAQRLDCDEAFILEVDAGWNGINSFGFVVPTSEEPATE